MSKMGDLNLKLQEEVNDLGYDSVQEAIADGWDSAEYYSTSKKIDGQAKAHEAWLEEKKALLEELENLHDYFVEEDDLHYSIVVAKAIEFIKKGEI